MTGRKLMQQALEAMGTVGADWICEASHHAKKDQHKLGEPCPLQQRWHIAYQALRERLAQPEQEPIAWVYPEGLAAFKSGKPWTAYGSSGEGRIPLYLNDAVAQRVEPRLGGSGAGFESLPASPTWWDDPVAKMQRKWQGLTDEEREQFRQWAHPDIIESIELKLQERNT